MIIKCAKTIKPNKTQQNKMSISATIMSFASLLAPMMGKIFFEPGIVVVEGKRVSIRKLPAYMRLLDAEKQLFNSIMQMFYLERYEPYIIEFIVQNKILCMFENDVLKEICDAVNIRLYGCSVAWLFEVQIEAKRLHELNIQTIMSMGPGKHKIMYELITQNRYLEEMDDKINNMQRYITTAEANW